MTWWEIRQAFSKSKEVLRHYQRANKLLKSYWILIDLSVKATSKDIRSIFIYCQLIIFQSEITELNQHLTLDQWSEVLWESYKCKQAREFMNWMKKLSLLRTVALGNQWFHTRDFMYLLLHCLGKSNLVSHWRQWDNFFITSYIKL